MTRYELIITIDDNEPRAALSRMRVTDRLASVLALAVFDGVNVTVRTAHPSMGPTTVHAHDGRVRTEREPLPPSSGESRDQSAPTDASRIFRIAGMPPDARD